MRTIAPVLATAVLSVACSGGQEPRPDYPQTLPAESGTLTNPEFESYATWDFHDGIGVLKSRDAEVLLRKTVGDIMTARGYSQPADGKPDFYVAYWAVAHDGQERGLRIYGYNGPMGTTTVVLTPDRRRYRKGQLVVDLVDGTSKKLVQRLHYSAQVYSEAELLERLPGVLREILKPLPKRVSDSGPP